MMVMGDENKQLRRQLAVQSKYNVQLQQQVDEQTLHLRSAQREVEELHSHLRHFHTAFLQQRKGTRPALETKRYIH